ncbi:hypothetical protein TNCV_3933421 [Trichonephila clavipes]|nr:hypothetical protein TNCV_3933421 [Trichonephila clavipes]
MHMKCPPGQDSWCFYRRALAKGEKPAPHKFNIGTPINPDYLTEIVPIYQRLKQVLHGLMDTICEEVLELVVELIFHNSLERTKDVVFSRREDWAVRRMFENFPEELP